MSDEILKRIVTPLKANNIFSFNEVCQMFPFLETYFRVLVKKNPKQVSLLSLASLLSEFNPHPNHYVSHNFASP